MGRAHGRRHFEADRGRAAAVAELGFDQREEVVGLFLVALGVGVPRHAEELVRRHLHGREQKVEVVGDHFFERNEAPVFSDVQEAGNAGPDRHLHPGEQRLVVVRVA